jgi:hypothetical protein
MSSGCKRFTSAGQQKSCCRKLTWGDVAWRRRPRAECSDGNGRRWSSGRLPRRRGFSVVRRTDRRTDGRARQPGRATGPACGRSTTMSGRHGRRPASPLPRIFAGRHSARHHGLNPHLRTRSKWSRLLRYAGRTSRTRSRWSSSSGARAASTPARDGSAGAWGEVRHSTAKHRPMRVLDA